MDFESKKFAVFAFTTYLSFSLLIAYWGWVTPGIFASLMFFMGTVNSIACSIVGISSLIKYFDKK